MSKKSRRSVALPSATPPKNLRGRPKWISLRELKPEGDQGFDVFALLHWHKSVPELERRSDAARSLAVSWRGFNVGTSTLVMSAEGWTDVFEAGNSKPIERPRDFDQGDLCGEMKTILRAIAEKKQILGMVVTGPHQPDDFSAVDLGVLISCGHCRICFECDLEQPDSPLKRWTRMRYVNPITRHAVELPLEKLLKVKNGNDAQLVRQVRRAWLTARKKVT